MKPDKYYIDASSFLEVTSELADYIMQEKLGDKYDKYVYQDDVGVYNYTEAGQDIFNNYVEEVEGYLDSVGIEHEDQEETDSNGNIWINVQHRLSFYENKFNTLMQEIEGDTVLKTIEGNHLAGIFVQVKNQINHYLKENKDEHN